MRESVEEEQARRHDDVRRRYSLCCTENREKKESEINQQQRDGVEVQKDMIRLDITHADIVSFLVLPSCSTSSTHQITKIPLRSRNSSAVILVSQSLFLGLEGSYSTHRAFPPWRRHICVVCTLLLVLWLIPNLHLVVLINEWIVSGLIDAR